MSYFGRDDPREMPEHFFHGAKRLDYATALRANPEAQNCSVCPRYWYVSATFQCRRCASEFVFSAAEQRAWYEQYRFWVDALPGHCQPCRRQLRRVKAARQDYDRLIGEAMASQDVEMKRRAVALIDTLYELNEELPTGITEKRRRLARALEKAQPKMR